MYHVVSGMRRSRNLTLKNPEERQNLKSENEFECLNSGDLKPQADGRATSTSATTAEIRISLREISGAVRVSMERESRG